MSSRLRCSAVVFATLLAFTLEAIARPAQSHQNANSLANWPSLRFKFSIKRNSVNVYNQAEFSMLATPIFSIDNTSVRYNSIASIIQDAKLYNYTEVDGSTYLSTSSTNDNSSTPSVECLNSDLSKLPSINSIVSAINDATVVSTCSERHHFRIVLVRFVRVHNENSDLTISVEYLERGIEIEPPTSSFGTLSGCSTTSLWNPVTTIGQALLTGKPLTDHNRKLEAAFDFSLRDSCSCKSKPRPCVFVHGLGIKKEMARNRDRFYYWGDMDGHAPCCSSMKYTYLNTSGNPWTSDTLQQKVCNRVMAVSDTSTNTTIADTIVVTHSMGNLMLAGAIANGKCSLDSSSTWVGLAGPMKGSMCSDFIQDSCAGRTTAVLETVAEVTGKCPPTTGLKSLPYEGGNHSSPKLDAAYKAAQNAYRTNVQDCPAQVEENDGMVDFDSCAAGFPESKFGNSYRDRFYKAKLNHFDMEFISGDALLDEAKMPVKWFECLL